MGIYTDILFMFLQYHFKSMLGFLISIEVNI